MMMATNRFPDANATDESVGLLLSGGLDSAILLHDLLEHGRRVQPFYIDSHLSWQTDELRAVRRYLSAVAEPRLAKLVVLELPLADVYEGHWSVTGRNVPTDHSRDEAVFLPGRNALLVLKAALWCQLHGIRELAVATLGTSPFPDATTEFFHYVESALNLSLPSRLRLLRPFAQFDKRQVMNLGRGLPLELTFSCLAPVNGRHCGVCNKCAERQTAFRLIGADDPTIYVHQPMAAR
jgi:7-cyano-7-deazaguanine synthase